MTNNLARIIYYLVVVVGLALLVLAFVLFSVPVEGTAFVSFVIFTIAIIVLATAIYFDRHFNILKK